MTEDVQTNLRLPSDLKDRVVRAAAQANRSLSAEVAHRLEESFARAGEDLKREIDSKIEAIQARLEMLVLRRTIVESRFEGQRERLGRLASESQRMAETAKTDAEFAAAEAKVAEIGDVERQIDVLQNDMKEIEAARNALLSEISYLGKLYEQAGNDLRGKMSSYLASGSKPKP
ncbi:MAG: Arc family DNA-binding protein [Pseudomonadota bacterium]